MVSLTQGELIEVGAHTVTHHPALAMPPAAFQQEEISNSKAQLDGVFIRRQLLLKEYCSHRTGLFIAVLLSVVVTEASLPRQFPTA